MGWFTLALISVASISIANLVQKVLMKDDKSDPYAYTVLFTLVATLITGIFAFIKGFTFPPVDRYPINFLLSASFYGFGAVLGFKALKILDASENALIVPLGTLVTIVSAVALLGETLSFVKVFGVILILLPIYLLNRVKKQESFRKGAFYAVGMAILFGLAVTNDAYILRSYDAISYTPVIFFLPMLILIAVRPSSIIEVKRIVLSGRIKNILIFALFYSLQAITYYLALGRGSGASRLSAVFKAETILTVLLATIFLYERKNIKLKILGAVMTTVGVLLLR